MKKIFFSYSDSQDDLDLYKQFNKHFANYARKGLIMIIDKAELFRINNDNSRVEEFLRSADITVPLLSADYNADPLCAKTLDTAAGSRRLIVPVLLREFDWEEMDEIKQLEKSLLPEDKKSVAAHVKTDADKDEVFSDIAKKVKAIVFNDFEGIQIRKNSGTFYYILGSILVMIGILAAFVTFSLWGDWKVSIISFLMFACIALFAVKNALFPTKFKIN